MEELSMKNPKLAPKPDAEKSAKPEHKPGQPANKPDDKQATKK